MTYDGYDDTTYATVTGLGRSSTVALALPPCWNFTAPGAGRYWTEADADTGDDCAGWALLYLAELYNAYVQVKDLGPLAGPGGEAVIVLDLSAEPGL